MKVLGVLLAAVPFAFAGIRLVATGNDVRYLCMAVVSTLCAVLALAWPRARRKPGMVRIGVATIAVAACVAIAGILLGARAASGIVIVGAAFGLCSTLGVGAVVRSRADGKL